MGYFGGVHGLARIGMRSVTACLHGRAVIRRTPNRHAGVTAFFNTVHMNRTSDD